MKFADPWWLPAGIAVCVLLIWMWRRYDARQHAALANFVSAHLRHKLTRSISPGRRRLQRGLYLAGLACLFAALAGPLVGYRWEQVSRRGNNIIFGIDTSRSMSTPDVKPDRLTRAKLAIDDFAKQLDGDAVGIVAFAGSAFLACPITLDYVAFHESLAAIDTNTIPRGGTNISSAIRAAQGALHRRPGSDKILILVTDGEDLEGNALDAARLAAKDGLKIYAVGVGTAAGDLIPVSREAGGGFVKDETGAFVRSKLDEPALKAIAAATGGLYMPLGREAEGLDLIFQAVSSMTKHDLASRQQRIYIQRYQWPLAASLALLLASLLVGSRRRSGGSKTISGAAATMVLAIIFILSRPTPAEGGEGQERATPATSKTQDAKGAVTEFNAGTAAYRAGQYGQAAQAFQQSINHAPSSDPKRLADQEDAYYNLGNTLYRTGQKTEQSAPQETLQKWNEAVKAYETALQLRADDADSKFNRDLVKRKIDALKQNQDQQKQNQPQDQNQQQNQNQQNQNKNQSKNQNQQQNQNQGDQNQQKGGSGQPPGQNDPKQQGQGQSQPPPNAGGSKGDQTPQQSDSPRGEPPPNGEDSQAADNQRLPGQMTREEARELLDSVKGDERHAPLVPVEQRDVVQPPEKPFKNW